MHTIALIVCILLMSTIQIASASVDDPLSNYSFESTIYPDPSTNPPPNGWFGLFSNNQAGGSADAYYRYFDNNAYNGDYVLKLTVLGNYVKQYIGYDYESFDKLTFRIKSLPTGLGIVKIQFEIDGNSNWVSVIRSVSGDSWLLHTISRSQISGFGPGEELTAIKIVHDGSQNSHVYTDTFLFHERSSGGTGGGGGCFVSVCFTY